jgi:hypothetical protein
MKLTTYLDLVPRLRMHGALSSLHFIVWCLDTGDFTFTDPCSRISFMLTFMFVWKERMVNWTVKFSGPVDTGHHDCLIPCNDSKLIETPREPINCVVIITVIMLLDWWPRGTVDVKVVIGMLTSFVGVIRTFHFKISSIWKYCGVL